MLSFSCFELPVCHCRSLWGPWAHTAWLILGSYKHSLVHVGAISEPMGDPFWDPKGIHFGPMMGLNLNRPLGHDRPQLGPPRAMMGPSLGPSWANDGPMLGACHGPMMGLRLASWEVYRAWATMKTKKNPPPISSGRLREPVRIEWVVINLRLK